MTTQVEYTESAIWRAGMKTTTSDVSIKTYTTVGRECIWEYRSGDMAVQYSDPEVGDYMTHPDITEIAEQIAEKVRQLMQTEDDGVDDRVMDIVHDQVSAQNDTEDMPEMGELQNSYHKAYQAVNNLLRPMILRVLDTGDWREDEND